MPVFSILNQDGESVEGVEEEGLAYFNELLKRVIPNGDLKEHIETVKNMTIRDDDVYIATYTKSGTHWIWEIVTMLLKGKAEYEVKVKETAMLDFRTKDEIEQQPSPRVLNSHHPLHLIPRGVIEKKNKIIHVIRNPKDIAVSLFCMLNTMQSAPGKTLTAEQKLQANFSTSLKTFMGEFGKCRFCPWPAYIKGWERFANDNPDQVLVLYFEDMKEDSLREIRKIKTFLNVEADETLLAEIAEACEFKNLKKASSDIKDDPVKKKSPKGVSIMYRKGEVGDWKNWFTVAENERFDKWLTDNLTDTGLRIRYELK